MAAKGWQPHSFLTDPPTNLKEAIDWVLRVTGKDGRKNDGTNKCLCFLAKAVKDLLYDAKDPGSPGPSPKRYWDDILLPGELSIVQPVLTDLGLLSDSTSAASTTTTCAGGTEVIRALIDQLAQGLQKWVGWQEKGDECCLKGEKNSDGTYGESSGIGKKCKHGAAAPDGKCCNKNGTSASGSTTGGSRADCVSNECQHCGINPNCNSCNTGKKKCYLSAYQKHDGKPSDTPKGDYYWPTISGDCTKVHLLARIFLGSVCLIWSGLSHLGFLTKEGSDTDKRWKDSTLHSIDDATNAGLGSFMAAMGYDLERLNGSGGQGQTGEFVHDLLTNKNKTGVPWKEFTGNSANQESVAEYYSSIYDNAKGAAKGSSKSTESICKQYPLLVLHILASGYFRAGSAGAKGVTPPPAKAATSETKKDTPRKPRTIREILYWLSALPYSEKYCQLVGRMDDKMKGILPKEQQDKGQLQLHGESQSSTTLQRKDITHYLLAACGYCPLVLIGIQGTINTSGTDSTAATGVPGVGVPGVGVPGAVSPAASDDKKCSNYGKKKEERTDCDKDKELTKKGQVCYGGYHLEVSQFGPLHGMYANGLFGFDMDGSAAQCLDQLRIYVYHCFYQLYFLRKQCKVGVESGAGGKGVALGWQSCRYGSGVYWGSGHSPSNLWRCKTEGNNNGKEHTQKCGLQNAAGSNTAGNQISPLMCFLCDAVNGMCCGLTTGSSVEKYPSIEDHMNCPAGTLGHFGEPPKHCPVPMGWQSESGGAGKDKENHFKDLTQGTHKTEQLQQQAGSSGTDKYPAHCTGNTLSLLLEYYCDPDKCHGTLVLVLRLLACITPTVPRTLGDLFGFYYYIVYIGGNKGGGQGVYARLKGKELESKLHMPSIGGSKDAVVKALEGWKNGGDCKNGKEGHLKCLIDCTKGSGQCSPFLCPLSGQQYGQLSPAMAGTYLSWLVYLIGEFQGGLQSLESAFKGIDCKDDCRTGGPGGAAGCGDTCTKGTHGDTCTSGSGNNGVCQCPSVVSCTGVLPVLYKYGFGYGDVSKLHNQGGQKRCHNFLGTLESVKDSTEFQKLTNSINQLIYTTRLPWIFVLTIAWLVAVLYLAFGAIWPLDWTHMRSHCRGWFRKGSLSPWEILMVGKKKGRGILEFFGKT